MTFIASLYGRTALAAAALMSGAALLASCAGTLDDDFKEEYAAGGDGSGAGDGQGTGQAAATSGGGGGPSATTGGDAVTTGDAAATTGGDPAATSTASTGGGAGCAEAQALVMQRCATAGCHDAGTKLGGLDLSEGWETRVTGQASSCGGGAMVIVPGDPNASTLYTKVTETPPCANRMPLGGALSPEEITCLHDFIAALAP
ncbi:hypothetical protein [Sorangium sp. So ce1078]|uniref:hypothetical protein n=1 Tax=Sorangium sp. So ce1078 TaxID=3133329 RepID=UPI003F5E7413